jgi:hypothetical protein
MRRLTMTALLVTTRALGAQNVALGDPTRPAAAASAPSLTAAWDAARFQPRDATLALTLSRPLQADDGRLVVVVGQADLSALLETTGTRVRLPLRGEALPAGGLEVRAFLAPHDAQGAWTELGRFPLKLLGRAGLEAFALRPKLDVQSDGQLDAHLPPDVAASTRAGAYQDLSLNGGVEGTLRRAGAELGVQALVVGASRGEARLRASQLGPHDAPPLDLASYDLRLTRGPATVHAGHVAVGNARHLVNQFRSRGLSLDVSRGRVQLGLAGVAGSELVGWGDPLGLGRPQHRVLTGSLGLEAVPNKPGLLRLDLAALGGSLQPRPGFLQGSVTDREESRGGSAQLAAADPTGRVRLTAGFTRSRFANPRDPTLGADSAALVPVRPETRDARFGELRVEALRGDTLLGIPTTLSLAARHERVDPQFRSVGATSQADRAQDALEVTAAAGALQLQATLDRARDNLDRVPTLLTTRTYSRSVNGALPVARLVRARGSSASAWWWPTLTGTWQSLRQAGDAMPPDGGFRGAFQVPDQRTRNATLSAAWQRAAGTLTVRAERSSVDNRQPERETSDVTTDVRGATLGYAPSPRLTLGLDLAQNLVRDAAAGRRARDRRVALQGEWRPTGHTSLGGTLGLATSDDPSATRRGRNTDVRLELSQGFDVYSRREGASQVRAFVRYARSGAALRLAEALQPTVRQWTVAGGLSARLF